MMLMNEIVMPKSYGLLVTTTLHYTWRPFRNGTLAGKGFIVSGFTIFGVSPNCRPVSRAR